MQRLQDDDAHLLLRMEKTEKQRKFGHKVAVRPDRPALTQIGGDRRVSRNHKNHAQDVVDVLSSIRFLDLVPEHLRRSAFPGTRLGDSGENLSAVLQTICSDKNRAEVFKNWIRALTPMDVADLKFPSDPSGHVHLHLVESDGTRISADSASDGTLRFLAMLAALLGKERAGLYFLEEIDNGIHPSRLNLLVDLIERQTAKSGLQIVTTTHSPNLLDVVSDETFKNMSVTYRGEGESSARIVPVADLPKAQELHEKQGLGRLHAAGWMEDMIALSDDEEEDE